MKTDRELLELAARAAGISDLGFYSHFNKRDWNPLTDDGDALRLATKLRLTVEIFNGQSAAGHAGGLSVIYVDHLNADAGAATRRAIVLVAAAIGEAMP